MNLIAIIVVVVANSLSTNAAVQWIMNSNQVETNMKNDSFNAGIPTVHFVKLGRGGVLKITISGRVAKCSTNNFLFSVGQSLCQPNNLAKRRMMCSEVMVKMKAIGEWSAGIVSDLPHTQPTYECVNVIVENVGKIDVYGCTLKRFDLHPASTSASRSIPYYKEGIFVTVGDKARDSVYVIINPKSLFDSSVSDFKAALQMNNFDTSPYSAL